MLNFKIPIFMYHSIESMPKSTVMRSLHVPTKRFAFQMWMLRCLGYKALSLKKLKPYLDGEKHGKVVGLTFDDGYQNNLINAAPILVKYNFSATCYIVSDLIGSTNIWDSNKGITQRPLMNKNEIVEWLNLGMDIGAHTKTHANLTSLSKKQALKEIIDCKVDLEYLFKVRVDDFCYPFGIVNEELENIVRDSGYLSATSMLRGKASFQTNRYLLPRIPINHRTLPHLFLVKLLTSYEDNK
jgi:peptidoglycan/xylan/chitin deacetylase (PgdA/CDA1 family)